MALECQTIRLRCERLKQTNAVRGVLVMTASRCSLRKCLHARTVRKPLLAEAADPARDKNHNHLIDNKIDLKRTSANCFSSSTCMNHNVFECSFVSTLCFGLVCSLEPRPVGKVEVDENDHLTKRS